MNTKEEISGVVELSRGVYWVGAIDWNGRDFHGFTTPGGTTYNSYLVIGKKTALIDTVKAPFAEEMLGRISKIIDPSKLDYIVVNHMEPDHSGSLAELKKQTNAKIIITKKGLDILNGYFREAGSEKWDIETVKTGDQLDLGGKTLIFLEATMLHWPDSMETFLKEDRILFSNDGFGQHIATSKRYDFEVGNVLPEAAEYYANILMPFHIALLRYFKLIEEMKIEPLQIAPSHGIIWKQDLEKILAEYKAWANGEVKEKVLVIYDTMWNSTEIMAKEITEAIWATGVKVKMLNLRKNARSLIMKEMLDAAAFAVGSPTLNNGVFPTVGDFLIYTKGLRPQKKKAIAFGSYGWGGGAVKIIEQELKNTGVDVLEPGLQVRYRPSEEDLEKCREIGKRLADVAKKQ
ncbi:rubredoxin-oxygen oxidoreductase [Methanosarcina barkeri str. Wiesmoor]|uniref:Rubredoxin-oxygen oxidoreductase n=2 Tax=Methanosarcina barkeri TaxID=2208 RepID=A0A0E3LL45_METBA|nr:FprA family A-type flavoprotein [Methanosarcina barkeri]AKB50631.1 rubredoxin-oxygen oxidoreductase [Methanosarcina barkeri str. Wiesmoor]